MKAHKGKSEIDGTHGEKYADAAVKDVYAGGNSPTEHEAEERKHGGRAKRKHGGAAKHHMKHAEHHHEHPKAEHRAKRKRGGHVHHEEHHVHGEHAKHRADRKARKHGGEIGANMHPLSTAAKGTEPKAHKSYEPEHD